MLTTGGGITIPNEVSAMVVHETTSTAARIEDINDFVGELTDDAFVSPLLLERYNAWEYGDVESLNSRSVNSTPTKRKHENNEGAALILYDPELHHQEPEVEPQKKKSRE